MSDKAAFFNLTMFKRTFAAQIRVDFYIQKVGIQCQSQVNIIIKLFKKYLEEWRSYNQNEG